jgi:hypothetical protein
VGRLESNGHVRSSRSMDFGRIESDAATEGRGHIGMDSIASTAVSLKADKGSVELQGRPPSARLEAPLAQSLLLRLACSEVGIDR